MKNLNYDDSVIKKYGSPPERKLNEVDEIVIHHTAGGGNWKGLRTWILSKNCERRHLFEKYVALTHFYIDKTGLVNQIFDLDTWTYHSCSGKHDKKTVGIELVHRTGPFTEAQYESLCEVIRHVTDFCPIKTIVSHDFNYMHYSGKEKGCPSRDFDWNRLDEMLKVSGYNFEIKAEA